MSRKKKPLPPPSNRPACEAKLHELLSDLLNRHCGGKITRLTAAIAEANDRPQEPPIERRKLTDFLKRREVKFSFAELDAIGTYLVRHNRRGLAAIFDRSSILGSLVERGRVTCLLGAQRHQKHEFFRLAVGGWDTRCLHPIFSGLGRLATHFQVDFEEVLWRGDERAEEIVTERNWRTLFQHESWYRHLTENGPSIVSIGSPKVNHGSEVILAEILGIEPFRSPNGPPEQDRFYFLWPPKEQPVPSAFALPPDAIRDHDPTLAEDITNGKASAFYFNGKLYPARSFSGGSSSYGVIVAQRRNGGATWVVIAGLAGPSTYAASQRLEQATNPIPLSVPGHASAALVLGVVAKGKSGDRPVDPREVTEHTWLPNLPVEETCPAMLPQDSHDAGQSGRCRKG